MPRTTTPQEICRLLTSGPLTSSQLAEICCCTQRYIRRQLMSLISSGVVAAVQNPVDKRGIIYSITTSAGSGPLNSKIEEQIEEQTPSQRHHQNPEVEEHIRGTSPKIGGQLRVEIEEQKPLTNNKQSANKTSFFKTTPTMHSNPQGSLISLSERLKIEEQIGEQMHPGTCRLVENITIRACESCPLQVCDLEHDTTQLGIIDPWVATELPALAQRQGWERRQNPHTDVWTLYPPALHPLTLQCGTDTVTIYSSEPGDTGWIVAWFVNHFGATHPHPERLAHKLKHPEIYRDEQTIVINDAATIEALRSVSAPYADPRNRVQYIASPNSATPGLKIYERDNTMRVEFDARDETRARAALIMRQELLQLLPDLPLHPGKYLEWRNRYYNPVTQPTIINLDQADVVAAIDRLAAAFTDRITQLEKKLENHENEELQELIDTLDQLDTYDIEYVTNLLGDYAGSQPAALVFLAAWQLWSVSKFKRSVIPAEVNGLLTQQHIHCTNRSVADAIELLTDVGLLAQHTEYIKFTAAGVAVGKRITAARKQDLEQ